MSFRFRIAIAAMILAATGCDQPPATPPVTNAPPMPTLPGGPAPLPSPNQPPSSQPSPMPVPAPATSPTAAPSTAPAIDTSPSAVVLQALQDRMENAMRELVAAFNSIQDDASADAAVPKIRAAGSELAASMEAIKKTVATLSLSGRDDEVDKFYQQLAEREVAKARSPDLNFPDAVERVVNSSQGPRVQAEVNALLDQMLAASTSGGRRGLERMIEKKKLRR